MFPKNMAFSYRNRSKSRATVYVVCFVALLVVVALYLAYIPPIDKKSPLGLVDSELKPRQRIGLTTPLEGKIDKLLVLYYFHFTQPLKNTEMKNLYYFLRAGVYANDSKVDYRFYVSSDDHEEAEKTMDAINLFSEVQKLSNARVHWIHEAEPFDGAFCEYAAMTREMPFHSDLASKRYSHFFFISDRSRGPFIPLWTAPEAWWNPFVRQLLLSPETATVSSYIACDEEPHLLHGPLLLDKRGVSLFMQQPRCQHDHDSLESARANFCIL